jgi:vitamin B12/bleomycin/antimicrobial peptide transport system ATP-binding/permease protein
VSIGHRSTLSAFHGRGVALVRDGDVHRLREVGLAAAGG